ncbi:MAG: thermonuclease family protein [Dehalococcoidia bacterium]
MAGLAMSAVHLPLLRALVPILVLLLLGGWQGEASPEYQEPPGCQTVYAATSRGGAGLPSGGLSCSLRPPPGTALVQRVVDGDTIVLTGGDRVRYVGIDTPEVTGVPEFFGPEATEANRRLVEGQRVRLERDVSDRDRFDRLLRYVHADGLMVNAELVREGFATALDFPPDNRYLACFLALEQEAREAGRGMWGR